MPSSDSSEAPQDPALAPRWSEILPLLLRVDQQDAEVMRTARRLLDRMAAAADAWAEHINAPEP